MRVFLLGMGIVVWIICDRGQSHAAPCPAPSVAAVCVDWTEATGGTLNLKETVVVIAKNGTDQTPIVVPATSAAGGGVVNASQGTVACEVATYTAKAYHNYNTTLGVMKSLEVSAIPVGGVTKDRTAETACLKPPVNFTLH